MQAADHLRIADNYLNEAIQGMPSDPGAAMVHAHRYTSVASDHIDKARLLDPNARIDKDGSMVGADYLIGSALKIQGTIETRFGPQNKDIKRGIVAIEKALKYNSTDAELYLSLALAQLRLGNKKAARSYLNKVIELEPTHHRAHELLDDVKGYGLPGERPWFLQGLIDISLDWKMWLAAIPLFWLIYCGYRMVSGLNNNDPDTWFYAWWFFGMSFAWGAWQWVTEKLGY